MADKFIVLIDFDNKLRTARGAADTQVVNFMAARRRAGDRVAVFSSVGSDRSTTMRDWLGLQRIAFDYIVPRDVGFDVMIDPES